MRSNAATFAVLTDIHVFGALRFATRIVVDYIVMHFVCLRNKM